MAEPPYRRPEQGEKEEKDEEKKRDGEEKQQEKHEEKQWDEKWQQDALSGIVWASILVWAGLVLLADNTGYLRQFAPFLNAWGLVFAGAGAILLLEVACRFLVPSYRQFVMAKLILALIFLGIGVGSLLGCAVTGALILIAIGVVILLGTLVWWRR